MALPPVPDDALRCALIGPSRVGKTSLVTAVIDDAQRLLQGQPVHIVPADGPTRKTVNQARDRMRGAIDARAFDAEALKGTNEPHLFNIRLATGGRHRESGVTFAILDYPGGWFADPTEVPSEREPEWEQCRDFMAESTVLLVPIDAAVLMETATPAHRARVPSILAVSEVEDVVREWSMERSRPGSRDEPAVLVLCPLKCEAYFDDNGGSEDRAAELLHRVQDVYGPVAAAARAEAQGRSLQVLYSPVDTYGCVELVRAEWDPQFLATYRVRPGGRPHPVGAAPILQVFCQLLVQAEEAQAREAADDRWAASFIAATELQRPRGFFRRLAFKWSGDQARIEDVRQSSETEAAELELRVTELKATVKQLADADMGPRVARL